MWSTSTEKSVCLLKYVSGLNYGYLVFGTNSPFKSAIKVPGRYSVQKTLEDVVQTWVANSASWCINDTIFYAKIRYNGLILQIFPNLTQNWLKFKNIS